MQKRNLWIMALIILPVLAGLACRFTAGDPTATPRPVVEATEVSITEEPTQPPVEEPTQEPTEPILEVPTQEEPPEITGPQDVVLLDMRYWTQEEDTVIVFYFFENPNEDLIFEDFSYNIRIFDENENEIDNYYKNVPWFFPGDTIMADNRFYLSDESITIDSASIDWDFQSVSESSPFGRVNPLRAEQVMYWPDEYLSMVTGTIANSSTDTFTNFDALIICYDTEGEFVGGGSDYIDFVPGENHMGFSTFVHTFGEVASVEVFPILTNWTSAYEDSSFLDEITVTDDHYYVSDWGRIIGGVTIQNNVDTVLSDTYVRIVFYDEAENVISAGYTRIDLLLPGETVGVSPWIDIPPEGTNFVRYQVFVLPGEHNDGYELTEDPFTINSATLTGDDKDVLVNFTNNYTKQVSDTDVYVLVYDADGKIIGGGSTWSYEPTPAGGTTEIEVWIDYGMSKSVASIEAWVLPTWLTDFE